MKKIIPGILFLSMAFNAYAKLVRETGVYSSVCGVAWTYVIYYDDSPLALNSRNTHLLALMDKADAACGTNISLIVS